MAFARIGSDSDVYIWPNSRGWIECSCCLLGKLEFQTHAEALAHLKDHLKAGHKVPKYALDELEAEGSGYIGDETRASVRGGR